MSEKEPVVFLDNHGRATGIEALRHNLGEVFDEFKKACIDKAVRRLIEHPDRYIDPYRQMSHYALFNRLKEEMDELEYKWHDPSEMEDVGNFIAWLCWHQKHREIGTNDIPSIAPDIVSKEVSTS